MRVQPGSTWCPAAWRRRAAITAVLAVLVSVLLPAQSAQALTVRPMTLIYDKVVNGDYAMVGNGVLQCDSTKPIFPGTSFTCLELHNATARTNLVNDYKWMGNVDVDSNAATANSSSATVTIPAGASVVKAVLYWSGNTGTYKMPDLTIEPNRCSSNTIPAGGAYVQPSGSASARSVTVAAGGSTFTVAPTNFAAESTAQLSGGNAQYYTAQADVTANLASLPSGSAQTITVGNLWAMQGFGCYAGWSLALVYDFGGFDPANAALTNAREILLYDGHVRKQAADASPEVVPFSGFVVQAAGSRVGFTLYEGDRNITGDSATYQSNTAASSTQIQNALGGLNNIGVSIADGSVSYVAGASPFVNANVDVRNLTLTQLNTGDTSMNLSLGTSGDSYLLQNAVLSVPSAAIKIVKTKDGTVDTQTVAVGATPTFTIKILNAGGVPLKNLAVADALAPGCARAIPGTLGVAPAANATYTYTCTGPPATETFTNSATVAGQSDLGGVSQDTDTSLVQVPRIAVTKAASPSVVDAGGSTTWTITVTNLGDEALSSVAVTDIVVPGCARPSLGTLAAGASTSYTCTSTGITAGFTNTVSATGTSPAGVKATGTGSATVQVHGITITKSASPTILSRAGQSVSYSFVVRNSGEVPLTNVAVTDVLTPPAAPVPTVSCPSTTLAVGVSMTCTATYVATQADADLGKVTDSASVRATDPVGGSTTATSNPVVVTLTPSPALTVTKSASPASVAAAGATVDYSFVVRNTGNVTLAGVKVTDAFTAPAGPPLSVTCPTTTLAPGASTTCTATYTVTQADIDAGSVRNTATASGTPPSGSAVTSPPSGATVTASPAPALTLVKTASPTVTVTAAGQPVGYLFVVTNTGNVSLSGVSVTDTFTAPAGPPLTVTCPSTTLAPGASTTCTASYIATQADVDHDSIVNTATASGRPPTGPAVTSPPSTATVMVEQAPAVTVVKSASPTTVGAAGDTVDYSFVVTNTGNVTVTGVAVTDTLTAPAGPALVVSCPSTTLAPDASATCTATYRVTQADVDAGSIRNSAVARGSDPSGAPIPPSSPSEATVTVDQAPAVTVVKSASPPTVGAAGDTVGYSFVVTNTGNVTLTGVGVTDTFTAPAGPGLTVTCPVSSLSVGASTTCTASYTVTQADVNAGSIRNSATASGIPPSGRVVTSAPSAATVTVDQAPALTVVKSASPVTVSAAGDTVDYSFVVTNTGNVTMTGVAVTDTFTAPAGPGLVVSCPVSTLEPAGSMTCSASYVASQADIDQGSIANSAVASGVPPSGPAVASPPSAATVTAAPVPALTVSKSADPVAVAAAGDTVAYDFVVTNTGNVTVTEVAVADTFTAPAGPELSVTCPVTTLAPAGSTTCSATYTVTQADIDAGSVRNSAVAEGEDPSGAPVTSPPSGATVTAAPAPALAVVKRASPTTVTAAGQTVGYSFVVTNTGNVTVTDVAVADTFTAPAGPALTVTCSSATLAPGASTTCSATYTVTQADVNAGSIRNSATASGSPPTGPAVTSPPSTATVTAIAAPSISVVKSADPATVSAAGDTVDYEFVVTNTGNQTLTGVSVADTFTSPAGPALVITCPVTTLSAGAVTTCTATYPVTQADVDAGSIANTATASGTPPTGPALTSPPSEATVTVEQAPAISVVKSASPTTVGAAGDTVDYEFLVTNTGNVTLTGVRVADTFTAPARSALPVSCPVTTLSAGASTTCTATYTVTQADVNAGSIRNSATASGVPPSGRVVTSPPSTATVTVDQAPALTVVKSASPTTVSAAGDTVGYEFIVTNTGNVTMTGVAVTDTFTDPAGPGLVVSCPVSTLEPAGSMTCSASYVASQADIDAGSIANSAVASGAPPSGPAVTSPPSAATVTAAPVPALTVSKSADPVAVAAAGDTVAYDFVVTNTGNVTVTLVRVADTFAAPAGPPLTVTCPVTTLAPAGSTTCSATYTVTQADIDAGSVRNSAVAEGEDPSGAPVTSPPSSATVTAAPAPALAVVKSASPTTVTAAGQTVGYSFVVTNTGNVTVSDVAVTDTFTAPAGPALIVTCLATTLAPGASTTCSATYTVTQADVDAGSIQNSAVAGGSDPRGTPTPPSPPSEVTVTVEQAPALTVVKSADPATVAAAGDTVDYEFLVTNTGNVTVTDVAVTDTLTAPAGPALVVTCPATTLVPEASTTCTATYTVTQADVDAGSIRNTAVAGGRDPHGEGLEPSPPSDATVTVDQAPALTVVKSASPTTVTAAGDNVDYEFVVTNAGNVTLTSLAVTDTFSAPAGPELTVTCPSATLAPGASTTCTASYSATQADIDRGVIANSAVAEAEDPNGAAVPSQPSSATVTAASAPALTVVKSASPVTVTAAGDAVDYSFLVTNTGNVTLTGVGVNDTLTAPAGPSLVVTCPSTSLAPGASTTCTATYIVTQADMNAGSVRNSATASGTPPSGPVATSPPSSATVSATSDPSITVVKSASPTTVTAADDLVGYSFLVTNTGNVTLTGVAVTDTFTAPAGPALVVTCPLTTLEPAGSTTCSATYTVTQADIDQGSIANSATASGTPPSGPAVTSPPSAATVTAEQAPALTITKSASPTTMTTAHQTVEYSFVVTNTGNDTLSGITVADTLTAPAGPPLTVTCPTTTLAPLESVTCVATYAVTQADIDHGSIANSATASGTPPTGPAVTSPPSSATVAAERSPGISVVKTASPMTVAAAGDRVDYQFVVTNTGNVTLTGVAVTDTFTAPAGPELVVTCPTTTLPPGESTTCVAAYAATQADINQGNIENSAIAEALDPDQAPVISDPSETTVTATAAPSLSIVKTADPTVVAAAGDTVGYLFLVTNSGNVTLTDVAVADTFTAPAGPELTVTCPSTALAPAASLTCTASYTATQADIDAGSIENSVVAEGLDLAGTPVVSEPSSATVSATSAPALSIVKTADPVTVAAAGDPVAYSLLVTNTGNLTLTDVAVTDTFTAPAGPELTVTCPSTALAPAASLTCTASYTATQADIDAGSIVNSAVAEGLDLAGTPVVSQPSSATVSATSAPALSIVKTAEPTAVAATGDSVDYSFVVTNTGNVTLADVAVTDTFTAPAGPELVVTCPITTLAPGASTTCTATYPVTQADIDQGSIANSATASGTPPAGAAVTSPPSAATVTAVQVPALTIAKSAAPTTVAAAGDTVGYSFVVTNTGNVTLTGVAVADTFTDPAGPELVVTCPAGALAPAESVTCTATYRVTQADIDQGVITNSATASALGPCVEQRRASGLAALAAPETCPVETDPSTATVAAERAPGLTLDKAAGTPVDRNGSGRVDAGDTVGYSFVVTNIGNVTLAAVSVSDPKVGPVTCPSTPLLPGGSMTCGPMNYVITIADVNAGEVVNTATATGTPPDGVSPPEAGDSTRTPIPAPLPFTGADVTGLLLRAGLLLGLGVLLVLGLAIRRGRRRP